ncbi:DTW domain protein [Bacteriovorax sp. BAL6_X]|uniref:tRNA-uridine aminocarboxypropyltransferase n=1 Tax=Bacteriovorax sp. BAL6_X TaxID=1201290 RepID=UPI000385F2AF|nr:tRNA-uridine aminocarboxypropyltransferase [Bacteriovorax sp. BAL6_X]EPZ51991.1 DTW domain protein [Bacteriovorax sp. BAL6_X]
MLKDLKDTNSYRIKCMGCSRPKTLCVCSLIKTSQIRSKIVILIHPMEAKKEKLGTGRITHTGLANSELIMGIDFTSDKKVNDLLNDESYYPMVLYPGEDALNISAPSSEEVELLKNKIPLIFVIDGTWPCAKKMMKLSTNINQLPRISFSSDKESAFLIKHQPHKQALSTVESVHVLVKELGKYGVEDLDGNEDSMIDAFKAMVQKQIDIASDPNVPTYRGRKMDKQRVALVREKKNRSFILK